MILTYVLILTTVLCTIFLPFPLWSKKTSSNFMPFLMGISGLIICEVVTGVFNGLVFTLAGNVTAIIVLTLPLLIISAFLEVLTMHLILRYFGRKFTYTDAVSLGLGFGAGLTCYQFFKYGLNVFSDLYDNMNTGKYTLGAAWTFFFSDALYYVFWTLLFVSISLLLYKGLRERSKKELVSSTALIFVSMLLPRTVTAFSSSNISLTGGLTISLIIICALTILAVILLVKGLVRRKILIYLPYIALLCLCLIRYEYLLSGVFAYVITFSFIYFIFLYVVKKFEKYLEKEKEDEKMKEESEDSLHSYY